jgi:hypothetical protein
VVSIGVGVALVALLAGCRGEQQCAVPVEMSPGGGGAETSCELKGGKAYNVVLQAEDYEDRSEAVEDDEEGFDDWDATVTAKIVGPDGEAQSWSGGTDENTGKYESEMMGSETVSFGLGNFTANTAGDYRLVIENASLGTHAPTQAVEVALRTD